MPFKGFTLEKILKTLTGVPYSADVYKHLKPFATETSSVIVTRQDKKKMVLNAEISSAIQSKWPASAVKQCCFPCEALGIGYNVETGVIWLAAYSTRGIHNLCGSECFFIAMTNKDGVISYRYVEEAEWYEIIDDEDIDELLPPPSKSPHSKKRVSPTPVCRIEADALGGDTILDGDEDDDWHIEEFPYSQYGESSFRPIGGRLVLKQDFSAIHANLKPGFEFDHLVIANGRNVKIVVGDDETGKVYKLKLNALELVAGDE